MTERTAERYDWNGRRVLVTGAGGFIGSHLAERLVESGAEVRAFFRYTSRGGLGSAGSHSVCTCGVYTEAYNVCSLPSLPLWASWTAVWKLGTLLRWVPA